MNRRSFLEQLAGFCFVVKVKASVKAHLSEATRSARIRLNFVDLFNFSRLT